MSNRYLEYADDRLILKEPDKIEYVKLLSQINDALIIKTQMISVKNKILKFTKNQRATNFYIDNLKCSGIKDLNAKRLQIPVNKQKNNKKGFPLGVYYSNNKSCYVLFDNEELSNNCSASNRSIWVDFNYIYKAMKDNINLKYKCTQKKGKIVYWIYISLDINLITDRNFDSFKVLDENKINEIETEINDFLWDSQLNNNVEEEILDFVFKKSQITNDTEKLKTTKFHSMDKEVGRIGEEAFNGLLKTNNDFILKKLNINKITEFVWNNENKESFLPYDFLVNNNIYIEIKATTSKWNYFVLSDNEYKFKHAQDEFGHSYYIANVTDVLDNENSKWHIFNSKEVDDICCIEKTERIYGYKYEK